LNGVKLTPKVTGGLIVLFLHCEQMTRCSPTLLLLFLLLLLLLLLLHHHHHSPKPCPPGPCFPKRASPACARQVSAPAATRRAAWRPSASSGAPASPPPPRPTLPTAHRATPAERLTVSPPYTTLTTFVNLNGAFQKYTVIITTLRSLLSSIPSWIRFAQTAPSHVHYVAVSFRSTLLAIYSSPCVFIHELQVNNNGLLFFAKHIFL